MIKELRTLLTQNKLILSYRHIMLTVAFLDVISWVLCTEQLFYTHQQNWCYTHNIIMIITSIKTQERMLLHRRQCVCSIL